MTMQTVCPHCGYAADSANLAVMDPPDHMSFLQCCERCGEYYTDHYKVHFLGSSAHGCNLYPADGETEESMTAAGVELDD